MKPVEIPITPEVMDEMLASALKTIGGWFKPGMILTLVIRDPKDTEAEWLISNEPEPANYTNLIAAIKRSQEREMVVPNMLNLATKSKRGEKTDG